LIKVALIIPVFNRRETTLQGLRSLARIDRTGMDVRTFVVDDGSTDGTGEAIRQAFPDVCVVEGTGNLHYAGGTNLGISAALPWSPDHFVLMNDDSIFHEQFLQRLVHTAEANPKAAVGALLLLWNEPHKVFQVGQVWRTWGGGWNIPQDLTAFTVPQEPFEVECIVGNCVLVPAQAIRETGVMDAKRFPFGWGDAQYFARLRKRGWKLLIEPKARVWCEPNTYPPGLHTQDFKKVASILFSDRRHPANLQRQFIARWESAPSKVSALLSFVVYIFILAGKTFKFTRPRTDTRGSNLSHA
jgi:GT2 family glycosyltransferase